MLAARRTCFVPSLVLRAALRSRTAHTLSPRRLSPAIISPRRASVPVPRHARPAARPAMTIAQPAALAPPTILLSDYTRPAYLVPTVDLAFALDDVGAATTVTSKLSITRAADAPADLVLDGEQVDLKTLSIDGKALAADAYTVTDTSLTIPAASLPASGAFTLEATVVIAPAANKALEGLYMSSGNYCSQCEAEGFRRITYFPDRPDVMSKYRVRVEGSKALFPVLLSNGNVVESGDAGDGRHYAVYEDPWAKPAYLFALVAGEFASLEDSFTTMSGKNVVLRIYVKGEGEVEKCHHAMRSLKKAMTWDEETYGLEYDLGIFNIVAVSDFSMGAMENKSLNIFNTTCVLASQATSTDAEFNRVESVCAHEYFHNYSGNRVTLCRWFELTLKEGLTVFRDQTFSADMNSAAVQRIGDVVSLRAGQFPEDAGPLAHPIRPTQCITPSTFYTATVYSKGAEIIRMLQTLAGPEGYRRGTDLYFSRHDGQAVTCEDFLSCIQETNPSVDFSTFPRWYSQAGTPKITVAATHEGDTLTLTVGQQLPKTSKQAEPLPMLIPMRLGLVGPDGASVLVDDGSGEPAAEKVLVLKDASHTFTLKNVPAGTIPSLFRGFSAPVIVVREGGAKTDELAFMMANDPDTFNSWESGQTLALDILLGWINSDVEISAFPDLPQVVIDAFRKALTNEKGDASLRADVLGLPLESFLTQSVEVADPVRIRAARKHMRKQLAAALKSEFSATLEACTDDASAPYELDPVSQGRRSLKNSCLAYLATLEERETFTRCLDQFRNGTNMTESLSALSILCSYQTEERDVALGEFYEKWKSEPQQILKWFSLQATSPVDGVLEKVKALKEHPAFELSNPNNVYALLRSFGATNMHYSGGEAYEFIGDMVMQVDALNPQVAARVARCFSTWKKYDAERQAAMKAQFDRMLDNKKISKDMYEVISSFVKE